MKTRWLWSLCAAVLLCAGALAIGGREAPAGKQESPQERTSYFRNIVLEKGETAHVLTCIFCSIVVRGNVEGDAITVWGNIEIEGRVEGDAVAAGGKITLRGEGSAEGDLVAVGGRVERLGTGVVKADVSEVPYIYLPGQRNWVFPGTLIFLVGHVLFSSLYLIAGRSRVERLAETVCTRAVITFIVGTVVMTGLVFLFLWASEIGKYEDEAMLAAWLLIMLLVLPGQAGVSLTVGRWLRREDGMAATVLVGALALSALTLIPLAGLLVFCVVWTFALGTTLVGRLGFGAAQRKAIETADEYR